jgi:hypothetical protein
MKRVISFGPIYIMTVKHEAVVVLAFTDSVLML